MTEHARLSASSAHRWTRCPASAHAGSGATSVYAEEGTAAHALAEAALVSGDDVADTARNLGIGDPDMVRAVEVYVDECRNLLVGPLIIPRWVERRVTLDALDPPEPMFGTCDFMAYRPETRVLYVRDLKYGQGVRVEAEDNDQLRYYALGALLSMGADQPVSTVNAGIVQPRQDDPIRIVEYDVVDLLEWGAWLMERAREAAASTEARPGKWCRFCPAAGTCSARAALALDSAQQEFAIAVSTSSPLSPPMLDLLTAEQVGVLLSKVDLLEDWIRDLRAAAHQSIEQGVPIPGWKLVEKRATRKWKDQDQAAAALAKAGIDPWAPPDLRSPADAEKALAAKMRDEVPALSAAQAKKSAADWLAIHVEKISSGSTLAPADDPRPALPAAGGEFFLPSKDPVE